MNAPTLGVIGVGKLGSAIARLSLGAGFPTLIAGSGSAARARAAAFRLAGAEAVTVNAMHRADVVFLALPFSEVTSLAAEPLQGKLVLDATNHWEENDGPRRDLLEPRKPTSVFVQDALHGSRVVKAFNHVGYHDLNEGAWHDPRRAIAIAGDDPDDLAEAGAIVDAFGFEAVVAGSLADSTVLEPGHPAFGASTDAATLRQLLQR